MRVSFCVTLGGLLSVRHKLQETLFCRFDAFSWQMDAFFTTNSVQNSSYRCPLYVKCMFSFVILCSLYHSDVSLSVRFNLLMLNNGIKYYWHWAVPGGVGVGGVVVVRRWPFVTALQFPLKCTEYSLVSDKDTLKFQRCLRPYQMTYSSNHQKAPRGM